MGELLPGTDAGAGAGAGGDGAGAVFGGGGGGGGGLREGVWVWMGEGRGIDGGHSKFLFNILSLIIIIYNMKNVKIIC